MANNQASKKNINTLMKDVSKKINIAGSKVNLKLGNPVIRVFLLFGVSMVITLQFIAPAMKSVFLIASWNNIVVIYAIAIVLCVALYLIYNFVVKLLLALFS